MTVGFFWLQGWFFKSDSLERMKAEVGRSRLPRNLIYRKRMEELIARLKEFRRNHFSGTATLSFYKGSLSKKENNNGKS